MPNWVHHGLVITGPEIERERFVAECFSEDDKGMQFDFNKLIPQPDEIRRSADATAAFVDALLSGKGVVGDAPDEAWYEWCCDNWGTKWNACDTTITRKGDAIELRFDTAWASPIPIFNAVAARFPKLRIEGTFVEEAHQFGADVLCQNGNVEVEDRTEEFRQAWDDMMGRQYENCLFIPAGKQQPDDITKTKDDDELPF
jgi:hypothetical protein